MKSMTTTGQETSSDLTQDELAVATILDAISEATSSKGVRRTMLLAIIDAAHERPTLLDIDEFATLDREQVAEALLALRARHLATLDEWGFHLTESGETKVSEVTKDGPVGRLYEELKMLVGSKLLEWSAPVSPA